MALGLARLNDRPDVCFADDTAFTDAVAAVQLPEGVEPDQVILRSAYGHPEVPDTVIDVNGHSSVRNERIRLRVGASVVSVVESGRVTPGSIIRRCERPFAVRRSRPGTLLPGVEQVRPSVFTRCSPARGLRETRLP